MWWKVYFWFYLVFSIFSNYLLISVSQHDFGPNDHIYSAITVFDVIYNICSILILYLFVFSKKVFSPSLWKNAFYPFIAIGIMYFISTAGIGFILVLPIITALYKMGDRKSKTQDDKFKWWKIYFWVNAVLLPIAMVIEVISGKSTLSYFATWFNYLGLIFILLALYSYAYKKRILNASFWKIIFVINIVADIFFFLYVYNPLFRQNALASFFYYTGSKIEPYPIASLTLLLLYIAPMVYVTYKLAFPGKKK